MNILSDPEFRILFIALLAILTLASSLVVVLTRRPKIAAHPDLCRDLNTRTRSWWGMIGIFLLASLCGKNGSILLFAFVSFQALREFVTVMSTSRFDHRTLFWSFFVLLPIHYLLIYFNQYGIWTIFLPVYGFLIISIRNILAKSTEDFLARTARSHFALMICVYTLSHAPALMTLSDPATGAKLLFYLIIVCQSNDVFQYCWGKSIGKRPIAPNVSPKKTVEGTVFGILTTGVLGAALWWVTPFAWWQSGLIALLVATCGFFGDLTLSAIKRDCKTKDYGSLIPGHGGVLDRVDSLAFAAPVFFHVTRYYFF